VVGVPAQWHRGGLDLMTSSLTTLGNREQAFLWIEKGASAFESSWIALHRFLWLNDMSGIGLHYQVCKERRPGQQVLRSMMKVSKIIEQYPTSTVTPYQGLDVIFKHRGISNYLGSHTCLPVDSASVRFCPLCLKNCFHATIFQLTAVISCPYHAIPLQTTCPDCDHPLGELTFTPDRWAKPLCCQSCGKQFTEKKSTVNSVLNGYPDVVEAIAAASELLLKLKDSTLLSQRVLADFDVRTPAFRSFYFDCLFKAVNPEVTHPKWLARSWCIPSIWQRKSTPLASSTATSGAVARSSVHEASKNAMRMLRSLDKQLGRRTRSICGHRSSYPLSYNWEYLTFVGNSFYLQLEPFHCPCCAALEWWRAQVGLIFGFHLRCKRRPDLSWRIDSWRGIQENLSLDSERLAPLAWSLFTSFALQMCARLETSNLQAREALIMCCSIIDPGEINRLNRGQYFTDEKKRGWLKLDVNSHSIPNPHLQFLVGEHQKDFTLSLSVGLSALEDCHRTRLNGLLWEKQPSFARPHRERKDKWYRAMAERANIKAWSFNSKDRAFEFGKSITHV
jgi:hypothetical protein